MFAKSKSVHTRKQPLRRSSLMGRICAVAALFLWPMAVCENAAEAGTATANLTVQVTITASCTINTATLDFGSNAGTTLISSAINAATTVSVTCTNGSPYSIGMNNGANASGSQRRMASGANFLNYNLYTDAARLNAWTTAASNSTCTTTNSCFLGTGSGSAQSVNIYGTVPSVGTAPPAGVYTDTVTMTITF
jgi:spore coat protein U-like protein